MVSPNHSPVTKASIEAAIEEEAGPVVPRTRRIIQLLDEIQLAAAQMPDYPESIVDLSEEVEYLHVYKQGRLMFLSGLYPTQWLMDWLPECTKVECEVVKTAHKLYAKNQAFRVKYPDMVVPIALRMVDHDSLVMDEPGEVDPSRGRPNTTE